MTHEREERKKYYKFEKEMGEKGVEADDEGEGKNNRVEEGKLNFE